MSKAGFDTQVRKFGRELKSFLYEDHVFNLLPECGWLDGGCRSLMKAILLWLGTDQTKPYLIVKRKDDQHAEHAIVKLGDYFLDGDGVSTRHALYQRWKYVERLPRVFIRPFEPSEEPAARNGEMPYYIDDDSIHKLAALLSARFEREKVLQLLAANIANT